MKQQKRILFSFLSPDSAGVQDYLNRLAQQGWELSELSDCRTFSLTLEHSRRTDLRYFVTTRKPGRTDGEIMETVTRMRELGWEPMATVNQFDLYESMPCREVELPEQRRNWLDLLRSLGGWLFCTVLSLLLIMFAWTQGVPVRSEWFLSNTGILLHLLGALYLVLSLYLLLWLALCGIRRERSTAPGTGWITLRGLYPLLAALWTLLLTAAIITDLVNNLAYGLALTALLVGSMVWVYRIVHVEMPEKLLPCLSGILAICLLLSLALHQVFPPESRAEMGTCGWRTSLSEVVRGEELGLDDSPVQAVSYERTGSWFVERTAYWEDRGEDSLSSTVYRCKSGWFMGVVQRHLLKDEEWKAVETDDEGLWTVSQGAQFKVLLREGQRLTLLASERDLLPMLEKRSLQ